MYLWITYLVVFCVYLISFYYKEYIKRINKTPPGNVLVARRWEFIRKCLDSEDAERARFGKSSSMESSTNDEMKILLEKWNS
jgi:hypothetical protein